MSCQEGMRKYVSNRTKPHSCIQIVHIDGEALILPADHPEMFEDSKAGAVPVGPQQHVSSAGLTFQKNFCLRAGHRVETTMTPNLSLENIVARFGLAPSPFSPPPPA